MKLMNKLALCVFTVWSFLLLSCAPDTDEKTVKSETSLTSESSQGVLSNAQEQTLKKAHETEEVLKGVEEKRLETLKDSE